MLGTLNHTSLRHATGRERATIRNESQNPTFLSVMIASNHKHRLKISPLLRAHDAQTRCTKSVRTSSSGALLSRLRRPTVERPEHEAGPSFAQVALIAQCCHDLHQNS